MSLPNESLDSILMRRLKSEGLDQATYAAYVCGVANLNSYGKFEAIKFRNNCLTVRVSSSIAAHELHSNQAGYLNTIKAKLNWPTEKPFTLRIVLI